MSETCIYCNKETKEGDGHVIFTIEFPCGPVKAFGCPRYSAIRPPLLINLASFRFILRV